jgi:hypothetical protein
VKNTSPQVACSTSIGTMRPQEIFSPGPRAGGRGTSFSVSNSGTSSVAVEVEA